MKATIDNVTYVKEYESKYGILHSYKIEYDGKTAYYSSKSKDQKFFVKGKECEFSEEERTGNKGIYLVVKPVRNTNYSNFGKQLKREQARYSTMGTSYVKDLIIAGKIDIKDWEKASKKIVKFMFELDKEIEK